jgi:Glu-tRNA(Gln) amidotransferase subunit E-like FAD-binding protein
MAIAKLLSRGIVSSQLVRVVLPHTRCRMIQSSGSIVYCAKYVGLAGLFRKDRRDTRRFGKLVCDSVAHEVGNRGFFTTDERPPYNVNYGITDEEYGTFYDACGADSQNDLVVIFAYSYEEAKATKEALDRNLHNHAKRVLAAMKPG